MKHEIKAENLYKLIEKLERLNNWMFVRLNDLDSFSEYVKLKDEIASLKAEIEQEEKLLQHQEPDKPESKSADIWKDLLSDLSVPYFYWNDILPKYMEKYDLSYHNQFREVSDEEIEKEFPIKSETTFLTFGYIKENTAKREGAKWMRDQLKNK